MTVLAIIFLLLLSLVILRAVVDFGVFVGFVFFILIALVLVIAS